MIKKNKQLNWLHVVLSFVYSRQGGGPVSQPSDWEQMARNVMITKSRRLK